MAVPRMCALLAVAACGAKPFTISGPLREGVMACGGDLSLFGEAEPERTAELVAKATVATIDRAERGIRVGLASGQSFFLSADKDLSAPIAVGELVDVSIECVPVGRDIIACHGSVLRNGEVVAFNHVNQVVRDWTIARGPLVSRRTHPNYGPTETYALTFTHGGVTATSPLRGCSELRTTHGTYRVSGAEIEHRDPRAADSSDYRHFAVLRVE